MKRLSSNVVVCGLDDPALRLAKDGLLAKAIREGYAATLADVVVTPIGDFGGRFLLLGLSIHPSVTSNRESLEERDGEAWCNDCGRLIAILGDRFTHLRHDEACRAWVASA